MKTFQLTPILAAVGAAVLLSACAYVPQSADGGEAVSADYVASTKALGLVAYIYGDSTVLEYKGRSPAGVLLLRDPQGNAIDYVRDGEYVRLPGIYDRFTAYVNGRAVTFSTPLKTRVFSGTPTPSATERGAQGQWDVSPAAGKAAQADAGDLLALCETQLAEARDQLMAATAHGSRADIERINRRLDEIEDRMADAASAIVRVNFDSGSARFTAPATVARALVAAGHAADQIDVRGRTDGQSATAGNARVALQRALSARRFLVEHGVEARKIHVFAAATGDQIAVNTTTEGRALNRRVDIEFVGRKLARLMGQSDKLGSGA